MTLTLSDFDFTLPEGRIATRPMEPRSAANCLVWRNGEITDRRVCEIVHELEPGDLLVMNDTKVIPARLFGYRLRHRDGVEHRAKIEATLMGPPDPQGKALAMLKPLRNVNEGETLEFSEEFRAVLTEKIEGQGVLQFSLSDEALWAKLDALGEMPLPPYIASARAADAQDRDDYQTVWAKNPGAVAAPTASLHFDEAALAEFEAAGIERTFVTLHVGAGTFLPVKSEDLSMHVMHSEWGEVNDETVAAIKAAKARGNRVIAVGTTALRVIESAAQGGEIQPFVGETDIFITPGYRFAVTDALITNFHLPKSTLLMLVAALVGMENMRAIYEHAIAQNYRFFSYGDASLLFRER